MLRQFRKLFGFQPPLTGLERILEDVKCGSVSTEDAAEQIRDLAARPQLPSWFLSLSHFMSVLLILSGIGFALYSTYFSFGTKETPGTVVEMKGAKPVVEYHVGGQRFEFENAIGVSPPAYTVGDRVTILYDPVNPLSAQINAFHQRWLLPFTLIGFGLIEIVIVPKLFGPNKEAT